MDAPPKILVYDGDCRFCTRMSKLADVRWLCGDAQRRPAAGFEGELAVRLHEAGVHNELAVLAPDSGEIRAGLDGILWLVRDGRVPILARLLGLAPVAWVLRHLYRAVAFNRRIISPPDWTVACACDPDPHAGYHLLFALLALLLAAGGLVLHARLFVRLEPLARPWTTAAVVPVAWALGGIAAWRRPFHTYAYVLAGLAWLFLLLLPAIVLGGAVVALAPRGNHTAVIVGMLGWPAAFATVVAWGRGVPWVTGLQGDRKVLVLFMTWTAFVVLLLHAALPADLEFTRP